MADCSNCPTKGECDSQEDCTIKNNPFNNVKRVIGVMSGKGGVGKSTVSVLLAIELSEMGYQVGILDADITGPSIPRLLGLKDKRAGQNELGILPVKSNDGISVISLNLLIENEQQPVIWRGPIISNTVKQFWEDVFWGDLDYLIIDMPPGTGDVALTVMQSIPISGMLVVSVPQDMVSMIVAKAVNMASEMGIKNIGMVQNMSYFECPDCGKQIRIFDDENIGSYYRQLDIDLLGELPMRLQMAHITDDGLCVDDDLVKKTMEKVAKVVIDSVKNNKEEK